MKIEHSSVRDAVIGISLAAEERFDVEHVASQSSPENGAPLVVRALRVGVDLITGEACVKGYGLLRNRNGEIGERNREAWLTEDQIPERAKEIINVETQQWRDKITLGGPVHY